MPWHPSLNQLRDTLADLYPDLQDARRVAASALLSISHITIEGKAINAWQSVLEEAEKQGRVDAVIQLATAEYPTHPALLAAAMATYREVAQVASAGRSEAQWLNLGPGISLELVSVAEGEFLMGSADTDLDAELWERPQHKVWLPEYWIGKYEVSVAQHRAFVQDCHYETTVSSDRFKQPDNHPIAGLNWYEAMVFCEWAGDVTGRTVLLPSEAEWEKAAAWNQGRQRAYLYPWGNPWDRRRCSNGHLWPGQATPVGYYSPLGDSPYGCADMAGNLWEWTRSLWGKDLDKPDLLYPYDPRDGREDIGAADDVCRVLRGGSFQNPAKRLRCAARAGFLPAYSSEIFGFRVVVLAR